MKVCSEIKRRIDEAEDVELFDIEVARHTDACGECRRFAGERAALRNLLSATARVTAPPNFNAVLEARLAEVKARQPLAWLNPAFYLRVGAATAALAVAVFVAQYNGMFNASPVETPQPQAQANNSGLIAGAIQDGLPSQFVTPQTPAKVGIAERDTARREIAAAVISERAGNHLRAIRRGAGVPLLAPVDAAFVDSGAILIPGKNGGRDVTVPTVSVGAQPMLYVNAGRQPQTTRTVPVSF